MEFLFFKNPMKITNILAQNIHFKSVLVLNKRWGIAIIKHVYLSEQIKKENNAK